MVSSPFAGDGAQSQSMHVVWWRRQVVSDPYQERQPGTYAAIDLPPLSFT